MDDNLSIPDFMRRTPSELQEDDCTPESPVPRTLAADTSEAQPAEDSTEREATPGGEHSFTQYEALKIGYRQSKSGDVVTFRLHPDQDISGIRDLFLGRSVLLAIAEVKS